MTYSNENTIQRLESGENLKYIFFWGHKQTEQISKSCFSQWYESEFMVNNIIFKTAEHYMMAEKVLLFNDKEMYSKILEAKSPGEAKDLGRKVKNFNPRIWEEERFDIVVRGNFHKFSQNIGLSEFLKSTYKRVLVEASPVDPIWGIGLAQNDNNIYNPYSWKGTNLLGYALMEVRDILNKIGYFQALENPILPPWIAHPEFDRHDIAWRMGYGEEHLIKLWKYLDSLSETEMIIYKLTFPEIGDWNGWYEEN